ncbi:uncharacterized protein LOC120627741 [Pararge aegeria]|uniref:Jg21195 protein n=2 Tax=Pararge aegeria TaxID=116150 RepID=A0A8S4RF98_9NEOP|nr:uncharacterized protein LOC120627741 [Pararge aegeria]XP_039751701.1 uncharacterized protein LOC120627741 [Pararge aegeria]XP_039751702.1 uncharacterized protein LOC120627741 [Pararge aegeria]CAH2234391.1 jg21195 [Pararge aegeria aegeria]
MEVVFNIKAEEDFLHVVKDILKTLYDNHSKPNQLINETTIATAKDEIKEVIVKTGCDAEKVYELLVSKGLVKERSKIVSSVIESRKSELLYSTLLSYNSAHGETVSSFDWSVKLVYGTSELKKLKYPIMQLALATLNKGNHQRLIYDLNKDMLVNMINVLENVDAQS